MSCPIGEGLYWHGCYAQESKYKKFLHADTFAHPAKMSMPLAMRIIKHTERLGLLPPGGRVIDFMAGTSRTGVICAITGHPFTGVELEPHFVKMSNQNRAVLEKRMGRKIDWDVRQGDARNLSSILRGGGVGVVSPPYYRQGEKPLHDDSIFVGKGHGDRSGARNMYGKAEGQIGNLRDKPLVGVVSPPYSETVHGNGLSLEQLKAKADKVEGLYPGRRNVWMEMYLAKTSGKYKIKAQFDRMGKGYSSDPSNIGNLPDKPLVGVVSPPYGTSQECKASGLEPLATSKGTVRGRGYFSGGGSALQKYSENPENIGNLRDAPLVGITSPPYGEKVVHGGSKILNDDGTYRPDTTSAVGASDYSESLSNIGNQQAENYLSAMVVVYSEAFKAGISPLVVVTKNPTRAGVLRRLDLDTVAMLEQAGYTIIDYHRAVLFHVEKQATLDGGERKEAKGRLSFFKRLSYQKGGTVAMWEDVIFGVRA